ncbi:hypothetical protein [Kitasatospora sp. NPDC059571]|uniref:hypothetical protein n=1 Tax=Kitasatospora sp. NPDC059571 TaxID=3346871 RepID=UPI00368AB7D9
MTVGDVIAFVALIAAIVGLCWLDARMDRWQELVRGAEKALRKAARDGEGGEGK